MAGKKKKKPAANPARGFATVSLPSKSREPETIDEDPRTNTQKDNALNGVSGVSSEKELDTTNKESESISIEQMTPAELEAHLENSELHNLADEHGSRIKSDATRQAARLRNERRQLRQQADDAVIYGFTDDLIRNITKNSDPSSPVLCKTDVHGLSVPLGGDDLLIRLWSLQEVLIELKMRLVDQALNHVLFISHQIGIDVPFLGTWGLQEALVWYAGLENDDKILLYDAPETPDTRSGAHTPIKHAPEIDISKSSAPADAVEKLANLARSSDSPWESQDEASSSSGGDDADPDRLVDRWIRLQTKLFEKKNMARIGTQGHFHPTHNKLTTKIQTIERDVLFDKDMAHYKWRPILRDLEIEYERHKKQNPRHVEDRERSQNPENTDIDALDNEATFGGIFDEGQEDSISRADAAPTETMLILDFGPWTGVSPRRLLEEITGDITDRNGIKFRSLHATSYSSRLQLDLRLKSALDLEHSSLQSLPQGISCDAQSQQYIVLRMESIATKDKLQSEMYLSTMALFLLSSAKVINSKAISRLPKVWKELFTDLDVAQKAVILHDDVNRLKSLRNMIHDISENSEVHTLKAVQGKMGKVNGSTRVKTKGHYRDSPDQARRKWQERALSDEFASMQVTRRDLPVYAFKQEILQAFRTHPVLIICADTGAGKSTQIPSYILESELDDGHDFNILVTQPRRISAISIARRVSTELGEDKEAIGTTRSLVGYAIRMESKVSQATRITFATTGVLLRMLQDSPDLDHIDCLILDEVHERTMDLDLLFIALKRLRLRRQSLRIVLMSATVDATKFSTYFDNAPVLDLPGRTFPVELKFLEDAIEVTRDVKFEGEYSKATQEHDTSDESDISEASKEVDSGLEQYSAATKRVLAQYNYRVIDYNLIVKLATAIATKPEFSIYSKAILIFMPGISEIRRLHNLLLSTKTFTRGWIIHMLHSSFSTQDLEKAFIVPPPGFRKIVIATNIAETGITIPDITAVIDTCKEKIMRFDERRQISRLTEGFIARASARQRKGRAARVQEGLCFHLVTRHHFENNLQEQPVPEILRLSLQDPILRVKIWGLGAAEEVLSAALDPPSLKNVRRALTKLQDVGAVDSSEKLTALGLNLAKLPLDVALGKMAIFGIFFRNLDAIVTIIASFSIKSIFTKDETAKTAPEALFARGDSDFLTLYNAYSGWKKAYKHGSGISAQQFCTKNHLSQFQLRQLEEEKIQLLTYLVDAGLMKLTQDEHSTLQKARYHHNNKANLFTFEIPARYDEFNGDGMTNAIVAMALYPKLLKREGQGHGQGYRNVYSNQQLQLAPTSIHRITAGAGTSSKPPEWLCYLEATQSKSGRLNALYSSRVTQAVILLLLGQADFKFYAGVVDVDHGRVRFSLRRWKDILALQKLREEINRLIQEFLEQPDGPSFAQPAGEADDGRKWLELLANLIDGRSPSGTGGNQRQVLPRRVLQP